MNIAIFFVQKVGDNVLWKQSKGFEEVLWGQLVLAQSPLDPLDYTPNHPQFRDDGDCYETDLENKHQKGCSEI